MASVNRLIAGLRLLRRDLQRSVTGTYALLRYLLSYEQLEVALGLFSAASNTAVAGQLNRYTVRVINVSDFPQRCSLSIDIYATNLPRHPEGHYAYFTKHLTVDPGSLSVIGIEYDWRTRARFIRGGTSFAPDDLWRGGIGGYQFYSVTARVCDAQRKQLDHLTVYQELTR